MSTSTRGVAMRAAPHDFARALGLARTIQEPWFACQALAAAARFAPDEQVISTAREAFAVALSDDDDYRKVAVTAWPFRALIERRHENFVRSKLPEILALAGEISNPVCKSDALFLVWEAFFSLESQGICLAALVSSCQNHFKADRLLRDIALILASQNARAAQGIADAMPQGKYQRQTQKRLAQGENFPPREFFWH